MSAIAAIYALIFVVAIHFAVIKTAFTTEGGSGFIFLIILIAFDVAIGQNIHRSSVTGKYKEANTTKRLREYHSKRMSVEHSYRIYNPNTGIYESGDIAKKTGIYSDACKAALKRVDEEYARPGTKTFVEVQNKKREYDATHTQWF